MASVKVAVGQVWVDNDPRSTKQRALQITLIEGDYAHCVVGHMRNNVQFVPGARVSRVQLKRFRPTTSGYRLALDPVVKEGQ